MVRNTTVIAVSFCICSLKEPTNSWFWASRIPLAPVVTRRKLLSVELSQLIKKTQLIIWVSKCERLLVARFLGYTMLEPF